MATDRSRGGEVNVERVLDWIFATRLCVALAIYGGTLVIQEYWFPGVLTVDGASQVRALSLIGLVVVAAATGSSYVWIKVQGRDPSLRFLLLQAMVDVGVVTGVVHLTGGTESVFPPLLYVALASVYAILVPLRSALLVAAAAALAYLADLALAYPAAVDLTVAFQMGVFLVVAAASGTIRSRLQEVQEELETVEGALRRLRLDTADVLRSLGAGVMTVDEDGNVAYMNPAAEQLLDIQAEDWLNQNIREALERRAPGIWAVVNDTLRRERGVSERRVEVNRTGQTDAIPVTVASAYLWRSGVRASVTLVLQDLRPFRRLEELQIQADRLQAVAELAASLAHEIRNPLASIRSAVEQLADGASSASSAERLGRLVRRESARLDRLLGQFTEFASIVEVERGAVDVRELLRGVAEVVREHPMSDEVELEIRVGHEVGRIQGDADLLHRALLNLVLNAIQVWDEESTGDGLTVRLVAESMPPEVVPPRVVLDEAVRIRVMDDGPGIAEEDLDRIFDPFFSRRDGGTGLGLAIVYRTVRAHGGSITVTSEPGEETTFELALPRMVGESERVPEARAEPSS